ncbi:MAG TPA: Rrf2 family transcriptional regulator [bacterium]|nr:Rrf2 family transcriptional regulator [bacterium]
MKLSTKGRYGARASLELALRYGSGPVMVKEIAASQDISERYLEHILNALRAAGIVKSTRGARGGYELSKDPSDITLGNIVRTLEGPLDIVPCSVSVGCPKISQCVMFGIWNEVKSSIDDIIDGITLREMVDRHYQLQNKNVLEYVI